MPLHVFTCKLGTRAATQNARDLLDVTRETADAEGQAGVFAPSWAILRPVLDARREQRRGFVFGMSEEDRQAALAEARERELAAWRAYVPSFLEEMRASYRAHRDAWNRLLSRERVVLACHCQAAPRCHRTVLATMILPRIGAVYAGELASKRDGVHVEMIEIAT